MPFRSLGCPSPLCAARRRSAFDREHLDTSRPERRPRRASRSGHSMPQGAPGTADLRCRAYRV